MSRKRSRRSDEAWGRRLEKQRETRGRASARRGDYGSLNVAKHPGKMLILVLWAHWCPVCRADLRRHPHLPRLTSRAGMRHFPGGCSWLYVRFG
jgi:hypothetical protein